MGLLFFTFKVFANLLHPSFSAQIIPPSLPTPGMNFHQPFAILSDLHICAFPPQCFPQLYSTIFPLSSFPSLKLWFAVILPKTLAKIPSLVSKVLGQLPVVLTNIAVLPVYSRINLPVLSAVPSFSKPAAVWCRFSLLHSTSAASSVTSEMTRCSGNAIDLSTMENVLEPVGKAADSLKWLHDFTMCPWSVWKIGELVLPSRCFGGSVLLHLTKESLEACSHSSWLQMSTV